MGDTANSASMQRIKSTIESIIPGSFVYSVGFGSTESDDRKAGYFGKLSSQISTVCDELKQIPQLKDGFGTIGFSQGSQFLRVLKQACDVPMKVLISVGGQHMGVSSIPRCDGWLCELMRSIVNGNVYTQRVQESIVQAQYFNDPKRAEEYLAKNIWLPYVNNQIEHKDSDVYKGRLQQLEKLVLVKFTEDDMVIPKESSWFGFYNGTGDLVPLEKLDVYESLGLREMDECGKIERVEMPGKHLQISLDVFKELLEKHFKAAPEFQIQLE